MLSFALAGEFLLLKAGNEWYFSSAQENGTLLHKVHQKCAPRTSALLSRLFGTDFQSVPRCLTPALLQALQWLALAIHLTQSLYRLCKVDDNQTALCRSCKSTADYQSGADWQSAPNKRDSKAGIRLCPTDRSAIRKCTFGVPLKQHILFLRCGKVPYAPLLPEQEEPVSFPKKWKERTFSVRKRRKLLCDVTKGTKNTEKGRGFPFPFPSLPL